MLGEAGSIEAAIQMIEDTDPDVVLLDVHMPDGGGVEVIRQVAALRPGQKFLALSVSDAPEDVVESCAPVPGYVTKSISGEDLIDAVVRVNEGDAVFSPQLAGFVLDAFSGRTDPATTDAELDLLTPRERGAPADRAWLPLQGDRPAAGHLGQDGRGACQLSAAETPALHQARAQPLGGPAAFLVD